MQKIRLFYHGRSQKHQANFHCVRILPVDSIKNDPDCRTIRLTRKIRKAKDPLTKRKDPLMGIVLVVMARWGVMG